MLYLPDTDHVVILHTRPPDDFERVPNLKFEDWTVR